MPHIPAADPTRLRRGLAASVVVGAVFWWLLWIIAHPSAPTKPATSPAPSAALTRHQ